VTHHLCRLDVIVDTAKAELTSPTMIDTAVLNP
jgi:hypothetical protein